MFLLSKTVWCCNNYFQNVIFQMVGYSLFKRRWFLCLLCIYQCLLYLLKMITFPNYVLIPVFWRAIVFFWRQKKKKSDFQQFHGLLLKILAAFHFHNSGVISLWRSRWRWRQWYMLQMLSFSYHYFYLRLICGDTCHSYFSPNTLIFDKLYRVLTINKTCEPNTFSVRCCMWCVVELISFSLILLHSVLILFYRMLL